MQTAWLDAMDERGETPLTRAMKSGHAPVTDLLMTQGRPFASGAGVEMHPLHWAACHGMKAMTLQYMRWGVSPDTADLEGETALHKAARHGDLTIAEVLVEHGAHINAMDNYGLTPLHWVALNGSVELAEFLLDSGADVNVRERFAGGLTPFALAKVMKYKQLTRVLGRYGGSW